MISNPYVSRTWKDRISEYPTRRILTDTTTLETQQVTVTRDEGTVTEAGDNWDASNLNGMESRINSAFSALSACGFVEVTGTLLAGSTTLVLSDASITSTSTLDVFTDVYGVSPTDMVASTGSVTLTFEAQESDLGVKVRVY
jgi:hypothetical protein